MANRLALYIVLLIVSIPLALLLNQASILVVNTLLGRDYSGYLWTQYLAMGFVLFYTVYIFLDITYLSSYPQILRRRRRPGDEELPGITVIVPAYNEGSRIQVALECILRQDYPRDKLEVIVVDDGSSDDTYEKALEYSRCGVRVIKHSVNMGRARALLTGFKNARYNIVVAVDADTCLDRDALRYIASVFNDKHVGCACGRLKTVPEGGGLLAIGQKIEYSLGYAYTKNLQDYMGWMLIPSGAFSAYRRELVVDAEITDTLAEDFDLGMIVRSKGYTVRFVKEAIAYTQIPVSRDSFFRQRIRWNTGGLQVMAKHSNAFFNPEYGATGLFGLPIHFLIGFCVVVMEFFGLSLLALLTILNPWLRYFSSYDIVLALATWLLVLKTLSIILLLPGVHYARRVYGEEIGFKDILLYWFIYYYILLYANVKGIIAYLERGVVKWK